MTAQLIERLTAQSQIRTKLNDMVSRMASANGNERSACGDGKRFDVYVKIN